MPPGLTTPDPQAQVTIANARALEVIAGTIDRWPPAGDQLFIDFDISETNLPAGSRVQIGSAVIELSVKPHTGCKTYASHYGIDALEFVSSKEGRALRLRGANCRVTKSGTVRLGDTVRKL